MKSDGLSHFEGIARIALSLQMHCGGAAVTDVPLPQDTCLVFRLPNQIGVRIYQPPLFDRASQLNGLILINALCAVMGLKHPGQGSARQKQCYTNAIQRVMELKGSTPFPRSPFSSYLGG